jgi:hypothetical protein
VTEQRLKLKCRVQGPGVDATLRIFDLYFENDRPRLVLAWERGKSSPVQCVDLDPAMLRRLGPPESLTYTYDGVVDFPAWFLQSEEIGNLPR